MTHNHTYWTITLYHQISLFEYVMGISDVTDPNLDLPLSLAPTAPSPVSLISLMASLFYQLLRMRSHPWLFSFSQISHPIHSQILSIAWQMILSFWSPPSSPILTLAILLFIHSHWPLFLSLLRLSQQVTRLSGLKYRNLFPHSFGGYKSKMKVLAGLVSSEGLSP